MPRNSLPRPAASLSLERHLRLPDQLPAELTSASLFGNQRPLELEIGSGKGLFIQSASGRRGDHNFLGIEIAHKYAAHAASRLAKSQRDNAVMIAGDAQLLLQTRIPAATLSAVHIYFPDPWWKKKHKKRRVINPESVKCIYRALHRGGTFHFWTDVLEYFLSAIEMIAVEVPQFGPPLPEEADEPETTDASGQTGEPEQRSELDVPAHSDRYRTHFERRSRLHDIPVYRVRYEKP